MYMDNFCHNVFSIFFLANIPNNNYIEIIKEIFSTITVKIRQKKRGRLKPLYHSDNQMPIRANKTPLCAPFAPVQAQY